MNGRLRCAPHKSVLEHLQEAFEKVWKHVHRGRVLPCSAELDLEGVIATPQGRVPKMNPDRTMSPEGRFVHDQQWVNEHG